MAFVVGKIMCMSGEGNILVDADFYKSGDGILMSMAESRNRAYNIRWSSAFDMLSDAKLSHEVFKREVELDVERWAGQASHHLPLQCTCRAF